MTTNVRWGFAAISLASAALCGGADHALLIQDRIELFTDNAIVETLHGMERRLATPISGGKALEFEKPWEGQFSMAGTVIKVDGVYRMFYRGLPKTGGLDHSICYAESTDGKTWRRPDLRKVKVAGWDKNNIVAYSPKPSDADTLEQRAALTVLYDGRPGVPARERYKSVRALHPRERGHGLGVIVSPDGLNWEPFSNDPTATAVGKGHALDTANVITWLPAENQYAIYMRGWTGDTPGVTPPEPNEFGNISPFFHGIRTIMRSTSKDLIHWSEPEKMSFGDAPLEHLYTIASQPYFRAPHLLLALPMRFDPDPANAALSKEQLKEAGIHEKMWKGVSDAVFMTSRGGNVFDRLFLEAFVRPGLDAGNWGARSQIVALGVVPTGATEMSFYVNRGYGTKDAHVERMTLRIDGFVSLHAGRPGGSATTRPLRLEGSSLILNYSTSPFGFVKVIVLDENGAEIPGFGERDAENIRGDHIDRKVTWANGRSIAELAGRTVRLKFVAADADIYSLGVFGNKSNAGN